MGVNSGVAELIRNISDTRSALRTNTAYSVHPTLITSATPQGYASVTATFSADKQPAVRRAAGRSEVKQEGTHS